MQVKLHEQMLSELIFAVTYFMSKRFYNRLRYNRMKWEEAPELRGCSKFYDNLAKLSKLAFIEKCLLYLHLLIQLNQTLKCFRSVCYRV